MGKSCHFAMPAQYDSEGERKKKVKSLHYTQRGQVGKRCHFDHYSVDPFKDGKKDMVVSTCHLSLLFLQFFLTSQPKHKLSTQTAFLSRILVK